MAADEDPIEIVEVGGMDYMVDKDSFMVFAMPGEDEEEPEEVGPSSVE